MACRCNFDVRTFIDFPLPQVGAALMHLYRTGILGEPERIDPTTGREGGWGVGIWSGNRPGEQL